MPLETLFDTIRTGQARELSAAEPYKQETQEALLAGSGPEGKHRAILEFIPRC